MLKEKASTATKPRKAKSRRHILIVPTTSATIDEAPRILIEYLHTR